MAANTGVTVDFTQASQLVGGGTISGFEKHAWVQGSNFDDHITLASSTGGVSTSGPAAYGMGGNDVLIAAYHTSFLYGGDGNDVVDGRHSQYLDTVDGGNGDDTLYTNSNTFGLAYGGAGNDTIYASGEIHGGDGNDLIVLTPTYYAGQVFGDAGDDEIHVIANNWGGGRPVHGGAGNDLLVSGTGDDELYGEDGFDTADFRNATGAVTMNLQTATASGAGVGADTLSGIENGRGGNFGDIMSGNGADNSLQGQDGADTISGFGGADVLVGGEGDDVIDGGDGVDTASYAGADAVEIDLRLTGQQNTLGAGLDTLTNIENLTGSSFNGHAHRFGWRQFA